MSKLTNIRNTVIDTVNDSIEKVSSPASRAGSTVERAGKLLDAGVPPNVIALLMTENSPNSTTYTEANVETLGRLYKDSKTKVVITSKQARSLIKDQQGNKPICSGLVPQS